jgi:aspartate dehydrogenase
VAATIGLFGLGLDRTEVCLGSDPALEGPRAVIEAQGAFGAFRFEIDTRASSNPKTSAITADSLVTAVDDGGGIDARAALAASLG